MTGKDLKNSILQLAIQGKLVPQNPNDEPASELLARIRQEKEHLVKEKKLKKKDFETAPITDEEKPFAIPESWEWVKISDFIDVIYGYPFDSQLFNNDGVGFPLIRIRDILPSATKTYTTEKCDESYIIRAGDMLIGMDGNFNVRFWNNTPAYLNQRVCKISCKEKYLNQKYLYYYLPWILDEIFKEVSFVTVKHLSDKHIKNMLIPLPPLAEQQRIVAKIEELMPLVEEYDKNEQKLAALNKALPEQLRQSVLQQAIMGRLVPQDDNDEPASELLARIRQEKERLVKEKKLKKKDLETTPITDEEKPFGIPESWEWCRLGEICKFLSRGKSPKYADTPNQYPVFAQKCNLKDGGISLEQARFLDPKTIDKWQEELKLKTDDILVNSTGTGTVCRTRLFHEKYLKEYPFTLPDSHVSVIRTFEDIDSAFYFFIFNSKHIQDYWEDHLAGSTNQKELYIGTLHNTIIPLPPLAEQQRIVAKIEELFSVIDNLKTC